MSGVRKIQRTEHRKQMTACDELPSTNSGLEPVESSRVENKGQTVFCLLSSDLCYLTPETIVITTFVTFLGDTRCDRL